MAPNFLSKFVKANGSPNDPSHPRARTISDIADLRARKAANSIDTVKSVTPSLILTTENSNSPQQPSTPGSLHRSDSPRRSRSRTTTPATPQKELNDSINMPLTSSPEAVLSTSPPMGLGIDLGPLPQVPEPALSHQPAVSKETNGSGVEHLIKKKFSTKSLKSLKGNKA